MFPESVILFQLNPDDIRFPDPLLADPETGLLATGGDLSPERLLAAYRSGIFPWYEEGDPILWWAPTPRLILEPQRIHVSRRLARTMRRKKFEVSFDLDCAGVIDACRETRKNNGEETWITPEMRDAYVEMHRLGHVHSVECRMHGELVGGLYGVAVGRVFCGESMFSLVPDASKVALVTLAHVLACHHFDFIDCQMRTEHLVRMGAKEITAAEFFARLARAVSRDGIPGSWQKLSQRTVCG